jgi:hypothetical protein
LVYSNAQQAKYGDFIIASSQESNISESGYLKGVPGLIQHLSKLNESIIFTEGFINGKDLQFLPGEFRDETFEAASFILPVPSHGTFVQKEYTFFIIRKMNQ